MKPLWLTCYSASHEVLFNQHFYPSFAQHLSKDFDLSAQWKPGWDQIYSGENQAFHKGYTEWWKLVYSVFEARPNRLIVASGCDFRFYRDTVLSDLTAELRTADLACLQDSLGPDGSLCTCLIAAYSTPAVRKLLWRWLRRSDEIKCGQIRLNVIAREMQRAKELVVARLPGDWYWSHGLQTQRVWDGRDVSEIPDPPPGLVAHHANWTQGTPNKMALLGEVLRRTEQPKR